AEIAGDERPRHRAAEQDRERRGEAHELAPDHRLRLERSPDAEPRGAAAIVGVAEGAKGSELVVHRHGRSARLVVVAGSRPGSLVGRSAGLVVVAGSRPGSLAGRSAGLVVVAGSRPGSLVGRSGRLVVVAASRPGSLVGATSDSSASRSLRFAWNR